MTGSDRGSVTIWTLGLAVVLLLFGGVALDFWRGLALQRELAAAADSAAIAAASGIDETEYRAKGVVTLEPARARALALTSIGLQDIEVSGSQVDVNSGGDGVTVTVESRLDVGLLGVFVDDSSPILVRATATAVPQLVP